MPTNKQIAEYGRIGSKIQGSSLVRDYCISCHEPIRVVSTSAWHTCTDCRPTGVPGDRLGSSATRGEIEYNGGRFHAGEW